MPTVHVPAVLRRLCGGASSFQVEGRTLDEVLRALDERCPGIYERVVADGAIRPELAVAIDGEIASYPLFEPLRAEAEVAIVPALSGGAAG